MNTKKNKFNIDFVKKFPLTLVFSGILIVTSLFLIFQKGLNYGVDFKGGAEMQVKFSSTGHTSKTIRQAFKGEGMELSSIQGIGEDSNEEYLFKLRAEQNNVNQVTDKAVAILKKLYGGNVEIRKTDIVGPKAGKQLRTSGFLAMLWALLGIMVYIALRFDFTYAPGAIVALFHDVVIILGIFALLDKEFSLQIVGALLAIIGYSVNDTVVVFDRVREYDSATTSMKSIINRALNDTLTRTVLTSLTTLLVSFIMFVMGGGVIKDFFFAITFGVIIGTYSSLFVASPVTIFLEKLLAGGKKSKAAV